MSASQVRSPARARDLGVVIAQLAPAPLNAITDVSGVREVIGDSLAVVPDWRLADLYWAAIEATEEAIVNALVAARTMVGRDGVTAHALPHDRLGELLRRPARIANPRVASCGSP